MGGRHRLAHRRAHEALSWARSSGRAAKPAARRYAFPMSTQASPDVPAPESTLDQWAPPPRKVRYARCGDAGVFELPRLIIEEEWADGEAWRPDGLEDSWTLYRRIAREVVEDTAGPISEDALVAYGPGGLVDLGVFTGDTLELYEPAQIVLPPAPQIGDRWTATHLRGERQTERIVELVKGALDEELVSVAEVRRSDGVMVLRNRYVRNEGWIGFEALVQVPGRPSLRLWSEALSVQPR